MAFLDEQIYIDTIDDADYAWLEDVSTAPPGREGASKRFSFLQLYNYINSKFSNDIKDTDKVYVSAIRGNNTTAIKGSRFRPYQDLTAALAVAAENDMIHILDGDHGYNQDKTDNIQFNISLNLVFFWEPSTTFGGEFVINISGSASMYHFGAFKPVQPSAGVHSMFTNSITTTDLTLVCQGESATWDNLNNILVFFTNDNATLKLLWDFQESDIYSFIESRNAGQNIQVFANESLRRNIKYRLIHIRSASVTGSAVFRSGRNDFTPFESQAQMVIMANAQSTGNFKTVVIGDTHGNSDTLRDGTAIVSNVMNMDITFDGAMYLNNVKAVYNWPINALRRGYTRIKGTVVGDDSFTPDNFIENRAGFGLPAGQNDLILEEQIKGSASTAMVSNSGNSVGNQSITLSKGVDNSHVSGAGLQTTNGVYTLESSSEILSNGAAVILAAGQVSKDILTKGFLRIKTDPVAGVTFSQTTESKLLIPGLTDQTNISRLLSILSDGQVVTFLNEFVSQVKRIGMLNQVLTFASGSDLIINLNEAGIQASYFSTEADGALALDFTGSAAVNRRTPFVFEGKWASAFSASTITLKKDGTAGDSAIKVASDLAYNTATGELTIIADEPNNRFYISGLLKPNGDVEIWGVRPFES